MTDDELIALARARSAQWHVRQRLTPVAVPTPRRHRASWVVTLALSALAWAVVTYIGVLWLW